MIAGGRSYCRRVTFSWVTDSIYAISSPASNTAVLGYIEALGKQGNVFCLNPGSEVRKRRSAVSDVVSFT